MERVTQKTLRLAQLALLAGLIVVLQWLGNMLTAVMPVQMSFVLIPIVIGGVLVGPMAGAILGAVFGVMTIYGVMTGGGLFGILFAESPVLIALLCMLKSTVAGAVGGFIAKALQKKNKQFLGVVLASAAVPIVNTGIFCGGMFLFQEQLMEFFANPNAAYIIFILLAGTNFLVEFAINLVLAPATERIVRAVGKTRV